MRKKEFTEAENRIRFITPEPYGVSWGVSQVWEELYFTIMRIIMRGKLGRDPLETALKAKKQFENEI